MSMRSESPVRRGLRFAVLEAVVVGGMFAATEAWLVPLFQVSLEATAFLVGLLAVVPQILSILAGPWAKVAIAWLGGNKRASLLIGGLQVACLLLLSVPLHFRAESWAVPVAMALIITLNGSFGLAGPAWLAWMGDLIPPTVRGRYLASRTRLFHLARLSCAGLFAVVISFLPIAESVAGLQIVLVVAAVSRLASAWCMAQQPEILPRASSSLRSESQVREGEVTSLRHFIARLAVSPMGRWTLVWAVLNGGVMISGPFFQSYMLAKAEVGGLGLADQPFVFLVLIYTSTVIRLLCYPVAGRLVDLHGPAACLRVAVVGIFVVPVLWSIWLHPAAIFVGEIVSGMAWAVAECAIGVLQFGCHRDPAQRAQLLGWLQTVCGVFTLAGSVLGTLLMTPGLLPTITGSTYHGVFLASAAIRLVAVILALRLLPPMKDLPGEPGLWHLIPGVRLAARARQNLLTLFRRADEGD